jgi:hypothetical protein
MRFISKRSENLKVKNENFQPPNSVCSPFLRSFLRDFSVHFLQHWLWMWTSQSGLAPFFYFPACRWMGKVLCMAPESETEESMTGFAGSGNRISSDLVKRKYARGNIPEQLCSTVKGRAVQGASKVDGSSETTKQFLFSSQFCTMGPLSSATSVSSQFTSETSVLLALAPVTPVFREYLADVIEICSIPGHQTFWNSPFFMTFFKTESGASVPSGKKPPVFQEKKPEGNDQLPLHWTLVPCEKRTDEYTRFAGLPFFKSWMDEANCAQAIMTKTCKMVIDSSTEFNQETRGWNR